MGEDTRNWTAISRKLVASSKARTCPCCERRSALVRKVVVEVEVCRWCDYEGATTYDPERAEPQLAATETGGLYERIIVQARRAASGTPEGGRE